MSVFVLDRRGKALMPCSEKRARKLLVSGRACVVKLIPFVIRLKAHVTKGKKAGVYIGRVAVRASGSFNIQTSTGLIQGISHRYCQLIQVDSMCRWLWLLH